MPFRKRLCGMQHNRPRLTLARSQPVTRHAPTEAISKRASLFFGVLIAQRKPSRGAEQDRDAGQGRGLNSYAAHQRFDG